MCLRIFFLLLVVTSVYQATALLLVNFKSLVKFLKSKTSKDKSIAYIPTFKEDGLRYMAKTENT